MGAIGGMLGTAGGAGGTGFKAPQQANIINPTTPEGVAGAQTGANGALTGSAGLLAALQAQNGASQQSNTLAQGNTLAGQLAGNNGAGLEGAAAGQQTGLNAGLGALNGAGTIGAATGQQGALNAGLAGMNSAGLMSGAATGQGDLNAQLAGLGGAGAVSNALGQQGALAGQLGGAGGIGAQTSAIGGLQNVLAQQQSVANGTGPNPAQAMLNQATGQNVANQAALMAGQRGAGANVGLMARQAAQQGAGIQQNAAGQAATMQANQQLNALNAMGQTNQALAGVGAGLTGQQQAAIGQQGALGSTALNQLQTGLGQQFGQGATGAGLLQTGIGQLYGQGLGAVGAQQTGINSLAGQGGAMVGQQTAQLGQNAGTAQNMVGNQIGATNQNVQNNLTNAGQQLGAVQGVNNAAVGAQSSVNAGNTALAGGAQKQQGDLLGGAMNGAGSAAMLAAAARGGEVRMAGGGVAAPMVQAPTATPVSGFGQFLSGMATPEQDESKLRTGSTNFGKGMGQLAASAFKSAPEGDSAGGDSADIGLISALAARGGGVVKPDAPGQKATKAGNSYANDKIPAMLSEGEVVIPRSVMSSPDPASAAAKFVAALKSKKGGGQKMADGGEALDPDSPAPAVDTPAEATAPAPDPATPQAPEMAPAQAPASDVIDVIGRRPPPTPEELDGQDALVAQDMARGHIKPETMESLYGKKDTLGKIGTLFGLLVSGAGSGLSHQPNAVLAMMQKQIDNDLDAQKNSNTNAQNWLRLSQSHALQRVEIPKVKAETQAVRAGSEKTQAETGAIPAQIKSTEAGAKAKIAEANVLGTTAAKNNMALHIYQDLTKKTDAMPPGATKDAATATLQGTIAPAIQTLTKQNNQAAAAKVGAIRAMTPAEAAPQAKDTGVNDAEMMKQIQVGKMGDTLAGASVGIPPSQEGQAIKEATLVKQNRAAHDAWSKGFQQLDKAFRGGILNEAARNAVVLDVASQMARAQGIQTNAEIIKLVDSMFPGAKDYGSARQNKLDYTQHQFEANEAGTQVLDMHPGLKSAFPPPPKLQKDKKDSGSSLGEGSAQAKTSSSAHKDGDEKKSKSGRPMVWKNGGWKYK